MNWAKLKPNGLWDWLLIAAVCYACFVKFGGGIPTGPQEICAVVVEESGTLAKNSKENSQIVAALNDPAVTQYMNSHGYHFANRLDPDTPGVPPWIQAAFKQAEGIPHPVLVVYSKDGRVLHKATVFGPADMLPVLKKYGGD
jgi:hypothetical protein